MMQKISAADLNSCHQTNWIVDNLDAFGTIFDNAVIASCIGTTDQQNCNQQNGFQQFH